MTNAKYLFSLLVLHYSNVCVGLWKVYFHCSSIIARHFRVKVEKEDVISWIDFQNFSFSISNLTLKWLASLFLYPQLITHSHLSRFDSSVKYFSLVQFWKYWISLFLFSLSVLSLQLFNKSWLDMTFRRGCAHFHYYLFVPFYLHLHFTLLDWITCMWYVSTLLVIIAFEQ